MIDPALYLADGLIQYTVTGYHVKDKRYSRLDSGRQAEVETFAREYLQPGWRLFVTHVTELRPVD